METPPDLAAVRLLAMALPDAHETLTWGHPQFRVADKIFCAVEPEPDGVPAITVKVGKPHLTLFLADPRFRQADYVGRHGWVTLKLGPQVPTEELQALIETSYQLVRGKLPKRAGK
ncbi:MAG: MmcQ/YjbR family DNA-binding protein [Acidobacteria bacterium]|nr:MmcQ/YjbR family DNA-binding protein [Acidobacteriota bacterium]